MIYTVISEDIIFRSTDNAFIPVDPGNMDYQRYLAWLDAGSPDYDIIVTPMVETTPE